MGNGEKLLMNAVGPQCFAENMTPSKHEGLRAVGGLDRIAAPPCGGIARGIPGGGRVTHRRHYMQPKLSLRPLSQATSSSNDHHCENPFELSLKLCNQKLS